MNGKLKVVVMCGAHAPGKYVRLASQTGKLLAENDYVTITGGGPGMMEAVNKGAFESNGESWGIGIDHPEDKPGPYFTYFEKHKGFDIRHKILMGKAQAFMVLPGGLGTILETLEVTQKKKFREIDFNVPLVLVHSYFEPLKNLIKIVAKKGFLKEPLEKLCHFVNSPQEAIMFLNKYRKSLS